MAAQVGPSDDPELNRFAVLVWHYQQAVDDLDRLTGLGMLVRAELVAPTVTHRMVALLKPLFAAIAWRVGPDRTRIITQSSTPSA